MRTVVESACEQEAENKNGSSDLPELRNPGGFRLPEFLWNLRIPNSVAVEVNNSDPNTVFHLAFAQVVQKRLPMGVVFQVVRDVFGEKDVTGIAAIHHALRHINPCPGDVGALTYISHFAH